MSFGQYLFAILKTLVPLSWCSRRSRASSADRDGRAPPQSRIAGDNPEEEQHPQAQLRAAPGRTLNSMLSWTNRPCPYWNSPVSRCQMACPPVGSHRPRDSTSHRSAWSKEPGSSHPGGLSTIGGAEVDHAALLVAEDP
jgi:hypothetical protein